ncbi:MAG: amidase [Anaerolineales bacterium]|nr:amidase [Anaerolineales bacterium]
MNDSNSNLIYQSATALAQAIQRREYSAREVVQAHLDRIAAVNPALNAVVHWMQKMPRTGRCRGQGVGSSRKLGSPARGAVHGQDWIETAGVICAAGYPERSRYVPTEDATVVARLRAAGGIFLGKTNVTVSNPVYGRTNNPYNLAYSPAGSSSGEAALIAAGGSPFGIGSDSGGSIRQPAHNCGIAGLKPSTGRVPLTGHFPRINPLADPRTVIGPMARYVEDLGLVLPIIAGPDWRDSSTVPVPLVNWRAVDPKGLRVAFYTHHHLADPDPACFAAVHAAAAGLAAAGLQVEAALPPRMEEVYDITRDYWRRPESESWDEWRADGEVVLSSLAVEQHLFAWDRFRRSLLSFMAQYDLVLTPAAELPARPHGEPDGSIAYTLTYSLTGYPCVVVRAGTSDDGMPVGVQVVARPWRDDVALAAAQIIEAAGGGWRQPPAL